MVSKSDTDLVAAVESRQTIFEKAQKNHTAAVEALMKAEPFYAEIDKPIAQIKLHPREIEYFRTCKRPRDNQKIIFDVLQLLFNRPMAPVSICDFCNLKEMSVFLANSYD